MNLDPPPHTIHKNQIQMLVDLNVNSETIKI